MYLILNSVLPVFAIIALGGFLRRIRLIDDSFIRVADRLVYYVCLPVLLFWKIGQPSQGALIEWEAILAVIGAVFIVFAVSLIIVQVMRTRNRTVGSFCQSCYRFNTYIGLAVIMSACGEESVRKFGVLIGFAIPFINVLAVGTLIRFSDRKDAEHGQAVSILRSIVSNPLILACILGGLYFELGVPFPVFVDKSLGLVAMVALPLALLSIGGSQTFAGFRNHFKYSCIAALCKLVLLPVIGYILLKGLHVSESWLNVSMIYFALPTSPANYILSSQLDSDIDLATSAIVLSTMLSVVSLSAVLILFAS